eukprot:GHVQ01011954.1.p1 GENE.GHVQ01011954.1~~GHVQ01011954.1.p1  ORF type:complete len:663 (-),score=106.03 GHVQ01011954.1:1018-3006(-)
MPTHTKRPSAWGADVGQGGIVGEENEVGGFSETAVETTARETFRGVLQKSMGLQINHSQCTVALKAVFRKLQPAVPIPDSPSWYTSVFRNYDTDRDGFIDCPSYLDIVLQYYRHHTKKRLSAIQSSYRQQSIINPASAYPSTNCSSPAPPLTQERTGGGRGEGCLAKKWDEEEGGKREFHGEGKAAGMVTLRSHIMFPRHSSAEHSVFEDYEFGTVAGSGSFGTVEVVRHKQTGEYRACKRIAIQFREQFDLVEAEISLLKALSHPNIIRLFETYHDSFTIYLIVELCKGGQLYDAIVEHYETRRSRITESQVCTWMRQILSACAYCANRGVVHRDIKPENILFHSPPQYDDDTPIADRPSNPPPAGPSNAARLLPTRASPTCGKSQLKIIDFGLSDTLAKIIETRRQEYLDDTPTTAPSRKLGGGGPGGVLVRGGRVGRAKGLLLRLLPQALVTHYNNSGGEAGVVVKKRVSMQRAGTPHYMAPEMIGGEYDYKCDMFSVGIIMFQLLSGTHPFFTPKEDDEESVKRKILNYDPSFAGPTWAIVSSKAKDLLKALLKKNPKKRMDAQEALSHPWFKLALDPPLPPAGRGKNTNATEADRQFAKSVVEGLRQWQSQNRLKQAILQLLAKELSDAHIEELRGKCQRIDSRGTGRITVKELKNC